MESTTIGRSYAEGVYALAEKHKVHDEFLQGFAALDVLLKEPLARAFLESPKIDRALKKQVLRKTLGPSVHALFLNYVLLVLDKRRNRMYGDIARQYRQLVETAAGRLHVDVTVAREITPELEQDIKARLSEIFGKEVVPHVTVDSKILGGIIVREGDQVIDGSLRRRLMAMRRNLINAR